MKLSLPISVYQMLDRFKISVFVVTKLKKNGFGKLKEDPLGCNTPKLNKLLEFTNYTYS